MMARIRKKIVFGAVMAVTLTGYACSLPIFSKSNEATVGDRVILPARLSGVIEMSESCKAGYYQVKLMGLYEGGQNQVETQSDRSGRFSLQAPPGHYLIQVAKDGCGSRQPIDLEDNTEHMISVTVAETKGYQREQELEGRLPASVLVPMKR
jgi:hypothetical protein